MKVNNVDIDSGIPAFDAAELAVMFGYANRRGVNRAIRNGFFPIPTFEERGLRFAHVAHVKAYFDAKKKEAEEAYNWQGDDEDDAD